MPGALGLASSQDPWGDRPIQPERGRRSRPCDQNSTCPVVPHLPVRASEVATLGPREPLIPGPEHSAQIRRSGLEEADVRSFACANGGERMLPTYPCPRGPQGRPSIKGKSPGTAKMVRSSNEGAEIWESPAGRRHGEAPPQGPMQREWLTSVEGVVGGPTTRNI